MFFGGFLNLHSSYNCTFCGSELYTVYRKQSPMGKKPQKQQFQGYYSQQKRKSATNVVDVSLLIFEYEYLVQLLIISTCVSLKAATNDLFIYLLIYLFIHFIYYYFNNSLLSSNFPSKLQIFCQHIARKTSQILRTIVQLVFFLHFLRSMKDVCMTKCINTLTEFFLSINAVFAKVIILNIVY